jgi:hypothetical protein
MCSLSLHSQSRTAPINTTTRLRIHCACQSQSKPFHHFVDDLETFRMAIGPLARILAQVIVPVVAVLARALPAAYAQALQNAKKQGVNPAQATSMLRKTITQQEAFQILNLSESEASAEAIQKVRRQLTRLTWTNGVHSHFRLFPSNTINIWRQTMSAKEVASTCNRKFIGQKSFFKNSRKAPERK